MKAEGFEQPTRAKPATQFNLTQRHKGHKVFF